MTCENPRCDVSPTTFYCEECYSAAYCSARCRAICSPKHLSTCPREVVYSLSQLESTGQVLGKGAYAKVRLVTHLPSRTEFALKVMKKQLLRRENALEQVLGEIALHKSLSHPHIIQLHSSLEDSECIYLVLEYAAGGSIFDEIQSGRPIPPELVRKYFRESCEAVQFLHANNILHRDIKPENLLLDTENNVKLCDFGWSSCGDSYRGTFCGTTDYMAPEMVQNRLYSFPLDVWALGVLLYEMIHTYSPFAGSSNQATYEQIVQGQVQFGASATAEARDLILKILHTDPAQRPQLEEILSHPYLQGKPLIVENHFVQDLLKEEEAKTFWISPELDLNEDKDYELGEANFLTVPTPKGHLNRQLSFTQESSSSSSHRSEKSEIRPYSIVSVHAEMEQKRIEYSYQLEKAFLIGDISGVPQEPPELSISELSCIYSYGNDSVELNSEGKSSSEDEDLIECDSQEELMKLQKANSEMKKKEKELRRIMLNLKDRNMRAETEVITYHPRKRQPLGFLGWLGTFMGCGER